MARPAVLTGRRTRRSPCKAAAAPAPLCSAHQDLGDFARSTVPSTRENWVLAISLQAAPSVGREQEP